MVDRRFPRHQRLTQSGEFAALFDKGRSFADRQFRILFLRNQSEYARLGIIVSRKHLPRAVDRNRLKRLIRENFRANKQMLEGIDVIVLLKTRLQGYVSSALYNQLSSNWKRVREQCAVS